MRPTENGAHFADHLVRGILLNEKNLISIKILLTPDSKDTRDDESALFKVMA